MLLYLHRSLEWMVLFLHERLGSSGVDARSTAYEILKEIKAFNIYIQIFWRSILSLQRFCKSWMHCKHDIQFTGFVEACVASPTRGCL